MAQIIQHNIMSLNSYNRLSTNNSMLSKNLEKLSSGYKINRAGDDAAGLAISEKMRAQITGLERASDNAQDGISLVQTAEGALTEVHSMLNRMVELATQSANGTYDNKVDRANLQKEIESLQKEVDRIAEHTNFNGINLLDGSMGAAAEVEDVVAGELSQFSTEGAAIDGITKVDISGSKITEAGDVTIKKEDVTAVKHSYTTTDFGQTGTTGNVPMAITINYTKADGTTGTKDIDFNSGASLAATLGNIKTAIEGTDEVKDLFNVSLENSNKALKLEAKIAGTNKGSVNSISIKTAGTGDVLSLTAGDATIVDAVDTGVKLTVTHGTSNYTATVAGATIDNGTKITAQNGTDTADVIKFTVADFADIATTAQKIGATTDAKGDTQSLDFSGKTGVSVQGATVTINGNTYEFVKAGTAAEAGNIGVDIADDADAKAIAQALADKINNTDTNSVDDPLNITAGKYAVEVVEDGENVSLKFTADIGADIEADLDIKQEGVGLGLQIGDTAEQKISVKVADMGTKSLKIDEIDIGTEKGATDAIAVIKTAINTVSSTRADLGAIQNRLEYTINNLATTTENLTSAESRIRDTDMAKEMMAYTKNNVLSQAAQAMLAQANQQPQQILQLLQ